MTASSLRSTNLERDINNDPLPPLMFGRRAHETLQRIGRALTDQTRTRAWSVTGPYGSGKSTLALLLEALLGPDGNRRAQALQYVSATDRELAEQFSRASSDATPDGFLSAVATARREPLGATIGRALSNAATRRWARQAPKNVRDVLAPIEAGAASNSQTLKAIRTLCTYSPILLVIDEFGKTLEYLGGQRTSPAYSDDDLFLLQELAEASAGTNGLPVFLLTLQHMSFLDYAAHSTQLQRREWVKIQGRFDDITMTTDVDDAVRLIARSIDQTKVSRTHRRRIASYADTMARNWTEHGLNCVLTSDSPLFAALYPLHPLVAVSAPLLAAQIGQNDRTLVGFLASDEPHTIHSFLATPPADEPSSQMPAVRLPQLYDYFLKSSRTMVFASSSASRWIEIDTRIGEAHGLPDSDLDIIKTIGLLNLIDSAGVLRASLDLIHFALSDGPGAAARDHLRSQLDSLIERGFLVYRDFNDEYRVWWGSDTDIRAQIDNIRLRCDDSGVIELVRNHLPPAIVAGQHSQLTGMLRHFVTAVSATGDEIVGPDIDSGTDGLLLFHVGPCSQLPVVQTKLPVAVGTSDASAAVLDAGREVYALSELSRDHAMDSVARREVVERLSQATSKLAATLADVFRPARVGTEWRLIAAEQDHADGWRSRLLDARSMAGVVSEACRLTFRHTPQIRNEMLGRHQLTSQGAKARRELMTRMVEQASDEHLGICGFGPDRAMYGGVLEYLGLHRGPTEAGIYELAAPSEQSSLHPAWHALTEQLHCAEQQMPLTDVFAKLVAPPYGVKMGVAPVIVLAALIVYCDEIALFEEGTYQPRLTADVVERLTKSPQRFTVKSVGAFNGQRRKVLELLAKQFTDPGIPPRAIRNRNGLLLRVAEALLDRVRTLNRHARQTTHLSRDSIAVRTALLNARDPADLIFRELPHALGIKGVSRSKTIDAAAARDYAARLAKAVEEIISAESRLRIDTINHIAAAFRLPPDLADLRRDLAARCRGFAGALLEPRIKGLVSLAFNDQLSDDEWLDPFVIRIAGAAMSDWNDAAAEDFPRQLIETSRALDRISYLYQSAQLDADAQPFTAELLTLTTPDGQEERTMIYTPLDAHRAASDLAKTALADAETKLGPDGARILLSAITRELLGRPEIPTTASNSVANDVLEAVT
ncbi:hypothetical protein AN480_03705 [Mycobacterium intracellulare subsp. chimaera]|nr:hypothetical protein AN480_03705 [Mycobacterium intracellulare subsp. chimaera]